LLVTTRVVSSAYPKLLISLPPIFTPISISSISASHIVCYGLHTDSFEIYVNQSQLQLLLSQYVGISRPDKRNWLDRVEVFSLG